MKKFVQSFDVMFSDCDSAQMVFYPNFFRWFDRATQNMFNEVGLPWTDLWADYNFSGMPIVEVKTKFSSPARMDDRLELESWIDEWKGKIFVVVHQVSIDGKVIAEGRETRIWAIKDPDSEKGIRAEPMPDDIRARFED